MKRAGLPEHRMAVAGFGASQPIATNATAQDRQKNRRVEILGWPPTCRWSAGAIPRPACTARRQAVAGRELLAEGIPRGYMYVLLEMDGRQFRLAGGLVRRGIPARILRGGNGGQSPPARGGGERRAAHPLAMTQPIRWILKPPFACDRRIASLGGGADRDPCPSAGLGDVRRKPTWRRRGPREHSDAGWFTAVGVLLAVNVFLRHALPPSLAAEAAGFVVTHLGILVLLAGCLATRQYGVEAQLSVFEGRASHLAYTDSDQGEVDLGFQVSCTSFGESWIPAAAWPRTIRASSISLTAATRRKARRERIDHAELAGGFRRSAFGADVSAVSIEFRGPLAARRARV